MLSIQLVWLTKLTVKNLLVHDANSLGLLPVAAFNKPIKAALNISSQIHLLVSTNIINFCWTKNNLQGIR
jgi:hypothetical protein